MAKKFLKGDWLKRVVFLSYFNNYTWVFISMATVAVALWFSHNMAVEFWEIEVKEIQELKENGERKKKWVTVWAVWAQSKGYNPNLLA